jgi:carbonic anhydrase
MQSLIDNARRFPMRLADRRTDLGRLAEEQRPEALFITCSDSRVVPTLITAAAPGELFELRTAGNIVPVHDPERVTSEGATIEYAVEVLGVQNVIVCGHSHCGAVGALAREGDMTAIPSVRRWLADTEPHDHVRKAMAGADGAAITSAVQQHVLTQLERLRTHPSVIERVKNGRLSLHGWFYAIDTGVVSIHQPRAGGFLPL